MTFLRPGALILGTLVLLLLLPSAALAAEASITEDGIDPDPVVADVEKVVSFTNDTDDDVRLIDDDGRWDSGTLAPGEMFTITFDDDGTYAFASEDGAITGTIQVGTSGTDDPTEEPTDEATDDSTEEPTDEATAAAEPSEEATAAPPADDAPPVSELAATGLPSAELAWTAALITLAGVALLRRTSTR